MEPGSAQEQPMAPVLSMELAQSMKRCSRALERWTHQMPSRRWLTCLRHRDGCTRPCLCELL